MDSESAELMPGLYTVRIRHQHDSEEFSNLAFVEAMNLIQNHFDNERAHLATIERQA